ncbi:kinase RLK-Pelle-DLSV family protein [Tanacetum coccineum]
MLSKKNLDTSLSNLPGTNNGFGFFKLSVGQGIDKANSAAVCRGDINPDVCQRCLSGLHVNGVRQVCPNSIYAIGWYDDCWLTYSNDTIFENIKINYFGYESGSQTTTNVNKFDDDLRSLLDKLKADAASEGALRKFASGNTTSPDSITIYAILQCSPDLSEQDCISCLDNIIEKHISRKMNGNVKGRALDPMCNFQYSDRKKRNTVTIVTVVSVLTFIGVIIVASLCIFMRLKKKKRKQIPRMPPNTETMDSSTAESFQYEFSTVQVATNDFSEDNKLGQGGFGAVYKGVLEDGHQVAVKRLANDSGQGDVQFKNEVLLLAKLQHRNLVRLRGFSTQGSERLLIYEFLPNVSLDQFIFDPAKRDILDWEKRYKIIKGVAKGLLYLHEDSPLKIIHRDMKASNVLLDAEMNAKIADFGMARLFKQDETQAKTSRIVGTRAYMPPEYIIHGHFSVKTDVYSFGVLVLEIVAGQRNHSFQTGETIQNLLSSAWKRWQNGTTPEIIDPTLKTRSTGSLHNIIRSINIGLLCVQENVNDRPTMGSIVNMLNSLSIELPQPSRPPEFNSSSGSSGFTTLSYYSK